MSTKAALPPLALVKALHDSDYYGGHQGEGFNFVSGLQPEQHLVLRDYDIFCTLCHEPWEGCECETLYEFLLAELDWQIDAPSYGALQDDLASGSAWVERSPDLDGLFFLHRPGVVTYRVWLR